MDGFIRKTLLLGTVSAALYSVPAMAIYQGDANYPVGGQANRSVDAVKAEHDVELQKMDEEYDERLKALEKRYKEKVTKEEERKKENMKRRAEIAELNAERTKKRAALEEKIKTHRQAMENAYVEEHNPFVEKMREKGLHYGESIDAVTLPETKEKIEDVMAPEETDAPAQE